MSGDDLTATIPDVRAVNDGDQMSPVREAEVVGILVERKRFERERERGMGILVTNVLFKLVPWGKQGTPVSHPCATLFYLVPLWDAPNMGHACPVLSCPMRYHVPNAP